MFKKILIPLDGSEHSLKIVARATGLAVALGARVVLFSVIDPEATGIFEEMAGRPERHAKPAADRGGIGTAVRSPWDVIDIAKSRAKTELLLVAEKVKAVGLEVDVRVGCGPPAEVIVSEAHCLDIDLIAMATRRESALARGILGSVTDRVLHSTPIPVLTLHPGELGSSGDDGPPGHVVVPLDGSELSERAVGPALEIARAGEAEIVFTQTVKLPFYGAGVAGIGYGAGDYALDLEIEAQKEEASGYLQKFVEYADSIGLEARASVLTGNPAQQIVEEASGTEDSIIVMASRGAGGLKRWVLGSVADKVVRSAHRPVIVIPPGVG